MKTKNIKITLIGVNFYPEDTAIGLYSTQMAQHLHNEGYDITVVTGFPYYPQWQIKREYLDKPTFLKENFNGIQIFRYKQYVPQKPNFIKRIVHLLDFTLGSFFNTLKIKNSDIIIVVVPFTSSILLGWILKKRTKAKLWIHIQDFEFDAAMQTGISGKETDGLKKWIFDQLFNLERWLFSRADFLSTISQTMLVKLKQKSKGKTPIKYLPNWIDINKINPATAEDHEYLSSDKFKILYSGNIGDKQDWDFFIDFLDKLESDKVQVVVVGDGSKRKWLEEKINNYSFVNYHPPVSYDELSNLLCSADLHILFQKANVLDTVMPSKLLGMMSSGRPSIVTGNINSEVKKVLEDSKGGIYISESNIEILIKEINKLISDKGRCDEMGIHARDYVIRNFGKDEILNKFENDITNM